MKSAVEFSECIQDRETTADQKAGGNVASGDDVSKFASLFGISRNRLVGFEMKVALDRKT